MSETPSGDQGGQASPSEGASSQDTPGPAPAPAPEPVPDPAPEPASEPEVIEIAPGKTVSVISPKLVYKVHGDTQEKYDVPAETTNKYRLRICRAEGLPTRRGS